MAMQNVTGARCTICGKVSPAVPETTVCPHCGGILDIEYDYDYIRSCFRKQPLQERNDPTMWRYLELLPVEGPGTRPKLRVGGSPCTGRMLWERNWASGNCGSRTTGRILPRH